MVSGDGLCTSRCDVQTKSRSHSAGSLMELVTDLYVFLWEIICSQVMGS